MPVSVVVGGQFGSEGKGKVAHWLTKTQKASVVVRVGGSNSGHTVVDERNKPHVFRHLPTACLLPDPTLIIGPGSYIDVPRLLEEIERVREYVPLEASRLRISPRAVVISEAHKQTEHDWDLQSRIGSTGSGTGAAVIERARRSGRSILAADDRRLTAFLGDTTALMRETLKKGARIVIEGTQGFGLSVLHAPDYPYTTSRDTSAAAVVSEAGLSPLDVDQIALVIRAFPIRVAGSSGPLPNETTWDEITKGRGGQCVREYTTVTGKVRRVAEFDPDIVRSAIEVNAPTEIVLNHLDYLDPASGKNGRYSFTVERFLRKVEEQIGMPVHFLGYGPGHRDIASRGIPQIFQLGMVDNCKSVGLFSDYWAGYRWRYRALLDVTRIFRSRAELPRLRPRFS